MLEAFRNGLKYLHAKRLEYIQINFQQTGLANYLPLIRLRRKF